MLDHRNPKRDLFALLLLAACVFLTLSLFSYSFSDPPGSATYPVSTSVQNICGKVGAIAANYLFGTFGLGAYFVLGTLVIVDLMLLARRSITEPAVRAIGWSVALAGIATLAALISPAWNGPTIGPGGYLGASGRGWLETHFASAGSYVLTISMIMAGLLLCTDYVILTVVTLVLGPPAKKLAGVSRRAIRIATPTQRIASDVEEPIVEEQLGPKINKSKNSVKSDLDNEEGPTGLAIKIRGKQVPAAAVAEDEDVEESDEEEIEESDEESAEDDEPIVTSKNAAGKNGAATTTALVPASGAAGNAPSNLKIKNLKKDDRELVMQELNAASRQEDTAEYELPSLELLLPNETVYKEEHEKEVRVKAKQIEKTFSDFGFNVKVVEIETGPVIAQYEVELEAGLRLSKITGLADDLAIALRVPSVRIVAPIPGKNTVGIEVPNTERQLVRLREVIEEANGATKKMKIPIFLGKDVAGNPLTVDLTTMPHLLIAGRTGTGKSVCLNSIIVSMLMTRRPDEVKMLMIDPKMVELSPYKTLPHLMHPVVTDMRKAEAILAWAVEKMEERYALLARAGVRHITVFNQLGDEELRDRLRPENEEEWASIPRTLPFIVIIADEIADLMMTVGKEVEQHIIRLAQKSRAVGIHLILATQKPTVDVITGLIKSNLPARIAFQVASRTDSRVVLDEMGADKLLGNGDMLFLWPGTSALLRGQGTYLSDDEINKVVDFVGTTEPEFVKELVQLKSKDQQSGDLKDKLKSREELYESAVEIVIREGRGSVSLLQRALGIGYGRAARLVDFMAEDGIVGEYNGSQAREVIVTMEQWAEMTGAAVEEVAPEPPPPARRNRIVPERSENDSEDDDGGESRPKSGSSRSGSSSGRGSSERQSDSGKPRAHISVTSPAPSPIAPFVSDGPTSPINSSKTSGATALATRKQQVDLTQDDEELDEDYETEDAFAEAEDDTDTAPWESEPEAVTDEWTGTRKRQKASLLDNDWDGDAIDAKFSSESDDEEASDDDDDQSDLDNDASVSRKSSVNILDEDGESLNDDDENTDEDSVSKLSVPKLKIASNDTQDTESEDEDYEDEVENELEQDDDEDETEDETEEEQD